MNKVMKIDAAKAMDWIKQVRNEIGETNRTLEEVKAACDTFPGENDVVFQLVEKTGNMLNDVWTKATNAYKNTWERIEEGINSLQDTNETIQEAFQTFVSKNKR